MPRGADSFNKHQVAVEQRRAEAQAAFGPKADYFGLAGGQIAAVRFLEQGTDIAWASVHKIPVEGRQYGQDMLCLDQSDNGTPCPFCQSEHKGIRGRSTKGYYNLIWRGGPAFQQANQQILANNQQLIQSGQPPSPTWTLGPVYKRNEWGSPERDAQKNPVVLGYADTVFLWKASKTVHDQLMGKDGAYGGLMSRDFTVRRQGSGKEDTVYFVEPLDVNSGAVPLSQEDQALAAEKYDLDKFIEPLSYEEAMKVLTGGVVPSNGQQQTFARGGQLPQAPVMPQGAVPAPVPTAGVPNPNTPTPFSQPVPQTMAPPTAAPPAAAPPQAQPVPAAIPSIPGQ